MTPMHKKLLSALAALAAAAAPVAIATAKGKPHHAKKSHTATKRQTGSSSSTADAHRAAETELTGDTKTQAEAAAIAANPGATVERSSTEDPAESSGAAYEVHITKSDGSRAEVLEDSSFTVLSTKADDHGPQGPQPGGDNS